MLHSLCGRFSSTFEASMITTSEPDADGGHERLRVCVVGSGTFFLSGISYYTLHLANELAQSMQVSVVLLQKLIPVRLYPGRSRAGSSITAMRFNDGIRVFDGIDWFWGVRIFQALLFLFRERHDALVLQWWTGSVLHTYLVLAVIARLRGTRVIVEIHELIATEEGRMRWVGRYVTLVAPLLMRLANAFVIHSEFDRPLLEQTYKIGSRPVTVIPIGPYNQYQQPVQIPTDALRASINLLYFGVIRPYKGLEDLIRAFDAIPKDQIDRYRLTVVGETWEGWDLPARLIAASPYRDRITFVNQYIKDEDVAAFFANADIVVLPYHRSSASGPLHAAMSHGLPIVVTSVGGLVEAAAGYSGTVFVPAQNPDALRAGIVHAEALVGQHFKDQHSWQHSVERYESLLRQLTPRRASKARLA